MKLGADVLLLANLKLDDGLANGSRGVIVALSGPGEPVAAQVRFNNRPDKVVTIGRVTCRIEGAVDELGVVQGYASREQLPLALCYALTVHKLQSQSISSPIEIDLTGWPRSDRAGQRSLLLVSLSRATDASLIRSVRLPLPPACKTEEGIKEHVRYMLDNGEKDRKIRYDCILARNFV